MSRVLTLTCSEFCSVSFWMGAHIYRGPCGKDGLWSRTWSTILRDNQPRGEHKLKPGKHTRKHAHTLQILEGLGTHSSQKKFWAWAWFCMLMYSDDDLIEEEGACKFKSPQPELTFTNYEMNYPHSCTLPRPRPDYMPKTMGRHAKFDTCKCINRTLIQLRQGKTNLIHIKRSTALCYSFIKYLGIGIELCIFANIDTGRYTSTEQLLLSLPRFGSQRTYRTDLGVHMMGATLPNTDKFLLSSNVMFKHLLNPTPSEKAPRKDA